MFSPSSMGLRSLIYSVIYVLTSLVFTVCDGWAERIFFAGYKGGFYIRSEEDGGMEMRLGGALQGDCRYYNDGDNIITLTLTDGDPATDSDTMANGTIVDPGALVTEETSDDGSDGICFIQSLF